MEEYKIVLIGGGQPFEIVGVPTKCLPNIDYAPRTNSQRLRASA